MKRKPYRYFHNHFSISISIGFLLLISQGFFLPIDAEAYSDSVFDDQKAITSAGRVPLRTGAKQNEFDGVYHKVSLLLGSRFRSQKGGVSEEKANRYFGTASIIAPLELGYQKEQQHWGMVIAPRISGWEEQIVFKNRKSVYDGEFRFFGKQNFSTVSLRADVGRGYQRLDSFGFLFVGMSNFASLEISRLSLFRLSGIYLEAKPEEEDLSIQWKRSFRSTTSGFLWASKNLLFWEEFRLFHFQTLEPNFRSSDVSLLPPRMYGSFLQSGFDLRTIPFGNSMQIDLFFLRLTGERKIHTAPGLENQIATNSYLGYFAFLKNWDRFQLLMAGLRTGKDNKLQGDRDANGYASSYAEPRVFGGYSSILLYQSLISDSGLPFQDQPNREKSNFNSRGLEMVGIQFVWKFLGSYHLDLFANRSASYLGIGSEGILRLQYSQSSDVSKWFLLASIAFAKIQPNRSITPISTPFEVELPQRDYTRLYFSAGIQF